MLTELQIKAAKAKDKAYNLYDQGELYIEIATSGSKLWRLKYYLNGREKRCSLGKWPVISLKAAREERGRRKKLISEGVDFMSQCAPKQKSLKELAKEWGEIDWAGKLWVLPASKTKMRKEHIIPLGSKHLNG